MAPDASEKRSTTPTQMNVLTPNRILQKGDEYRDNGTWKPVPKDDYGLQIMFTKYAEVRRPSEKHFPVPTRTGEPSIESRPLPTVPKTTTSEGAKRSSSASTTPPPGSAGHNPEQAAKCATSGRENPLPTAPLAQSEKEIVDAGLPTFVSRKAHLKAVGFDHKGQLVRETAPNPTPDPVPRSYEFPKICKTCGSILCSGDPCADPTHAILPPAPVGLSAPTTYQEIMFPVGSPRTIWTGRNGTFNSVAVNLHRYKGTDICAIIPQGKRGAAKNAVIEFPVTAIPQMIDFLKRQLL